MKQGFAGWDRHWQHCNSLAVYAICKNCCRKELIVGVCHFLTVLEKGKLWDLRKPSVLSCDLLSALIYDTMTLSPEAGNISWPRDGESTVIMLSFHKQSAVSSGTDVKTEHQSRGYSQLEKKPCLLNMQAKTNIGLLQVKTRKGVKDKCENRCRWW